MELLKAKNLGKKYIRKTVLDDLEFTLEVGKVYGLLGPNASGKTTLLKLIAGITQPSKGTLGIMGRRIGAETKGIVSYLPTVNHLSKWMTVGQCLNFYRDFFPDFNSEQALGRSESMGLKLNQKITSLSTGMLGRLKIVLAMSRQARLYLLDEPLNGLDPLSREKVLEMILDSVKEESTIFLATHIIREIEGILDEVIFLDNGKIALAGVVDDLRQAKNMSLEDLYREVYGNA